MFDYIVNERDFDEHHADLLEKTIRLIESDGKPIPGPGTKVRNKGMQWIGGRVLYEGEEAYITDVIIRHPDVVPCFELDYATTLSAWNPYTADDCIGQINDIKPMILDMARSELARIRAKLKRTAA